MKYASYYNGEKHIVIDYYADHDSENIKLILCSLQNIYIHR